MSEKTKVRINFKSGLSVDVEVADITATRGNVHGELRALEWEGIDPTPLFLDLKEVESIWQLDFPDDEREGGKR